MKINFRLLRDFSSRMLGNKSKGQIVVVDADYGAFLITKGFAEPCGDDDAKKLKDWGDSQDSRSLSQQVDQALTKSSGGKSEKSQSKEKPKSLQSTQATNTAENVMESTPATGDGGKSTTKKRKSTKAAKSGPKTDGAPKGTE